MTQSPFAAWLTEEMAALGFDRHRSQHLYSKRELSSGNAAAIRFRVRSLGAPGRNAVFVHLCVASRRLAAVFGEPAHLDPEEGVQPWVRWSGYIHEPFDEEAIWHGLDAEDAALMDCADLDLRHRIVPALDEHISDDGLLACWLQHDDPFLPRLVQLVYVAVLQREMGSLAGVAETDAQLRDALRKRDVPGLADAMPGLRYLGLRP